MGFLFNIYLMKFIKTFESYNADTLIIVDVQKSFKKYFSEMYLNELKKYCKNFQNVYQLWDNHVDGKNVDKDYLYDETPDIPVHKDLYHFPNQKELIEKRYNYDVDADFYKKILDKEVYAPLLCRLLIPYYLGSVSYPIFFTLFNYISLLFKNIF